MTPSPMLATTTDDILLWIAFAAAVALAIVLTLHVWNDRRSRRIRLDDPNGIRPSDVEHAIRAAARFDRSETATESVVAQVEAHSDQLRDLLHHAIDELAVRPAADPIVRYLHANGPADLDTLAELAGTDVLDRIRHLVATHQIATVSTDAAPAAMYRFIPHSERPDDVAYGGHRRAWALNRLTALATTSSTTEPGGPLPFLAAPDGELVRLEGHILRHAGGRRHPALPARGDSR